MAALRFEALNELGDRVERRLILEAISHKTNLLLLDGEGRILDCIRHTGGTLLPAACSSRGCFTACPPVLTRRIP